MLVRASRLVERVTQNVGVFGSRTAVLAFDINAASLKTALELLDEVTSVSVTGSGPWELTLDSSQLFSGVLALLVGDGALLTGDTDATAITVVADPDDLTVQTVTLTGSPTAGTFRLRVGRHAAPLRDATAEQVRWWINSGEGFRSERLKVLRAGRVTQEWGEGAGPVGEQLSEASWSVLFNAGLGRSPTPMV